MSGFARASRLVSAACCALPIWTAMAERGRLDELPPAPPAFGARELGRPLACPAAPGAAVSSADAAQLRTYARCAQELAAERCRGGAGTSAIAGELAAHFSVSPTRTIKGLRRLNGLSASQKTWCELSVDDYASILGYAASPRAERSDEWIRFALGDESGAIEPGGIARAMEQRRDLVRDARTAAFAAEAAPWIAALPPSPGGWTNLTGYEHPVGRINDLLIHPTSPQTMWAAADGGGIWRTSDGGASWQPVDDFLGSLSISGFAMRPADPSTLYAATGAQGSHGAPLGAGVFKSVDGGATWSQLPLTDPAAYPDWKSTYQLAVHPGDSNLVLAATSGGAYQSADGGASWTKLFTGQTRNVAIHPLDGNVRVFAMDDGTLRVTADGANYATHTIVAAAAPSYTRIALAPSDPSVMYALVRSGGVTVLYRSANGGANWTQVPSPTSFAASSLLSYTGAIWVDPTDPKRIAIAELWASVTADASAPAPVWKDLCCGWVDFHRVVSDPGYNGTSNKIVYFMDDGGLYRWNDIDQVDSVNPAYLAVNGMTTTQVYSVSGRGGNVILGAQDVAPRVHRAGTNGTRWRFLTDSATGRPVIGDGGITAADRTNPQTLYGSRQRLDLWRSTDGGSNAALISPPATGSVGFIAPFVLDPNNQGTMLAGNASLWRANGISSGTPAWSEIHAGTGSVVTAIAVAPSSSDVIWVAYANGTVFRTANGTAATPSWTQVTVPSGNILRIYIDRSDPNRVYLGLSGFLAGRLRLTTDGGATWNAVGGLPAASVFAIQQHPAIADWLYVGTAVGLFASEDRGASWTTTNHGPASVQVRDLSWYAESGASAILLVATFGRGVWRAELNPEASAGALRFQSPAYTARVGGPGAVLEVARSGGYAGAVSVRYATADGTARAGTDYAAVAGVLSWADGDPSVKQITVPLLESGTSQGGKTFTVTLDAPGGGAGLGAPASATVTLADAELFPRDCRLPSGWFVPPTANAGWSVATDQAYEGGCSLKSAAIDNGQAAEIAYTGNFTSGNIIFRRKVSSETVNGYDWDFFSFYIDGVEQQAAHGGGERGWIAPPEGFSFPISAGIHTIKFRYEKDAECCSAGSDAAWIDAVTLPLAADTSLTVTHGGHGTVTSTPAGIACGSTCSALFAQGATVTLTAYPDPGYAFGGWSGACSGTATCRLTMDAARGVAATFVALPDVSAPTVPAGLAATPASSSRIDLTWSASTDDYGVATYRVFRDEVLHASVSAPSVRYSDTGLTASTAYSYAVAACDAAGNCSDRSAAVGATTLPPGTALTGGFNLLGHAAGTPIDVAQTFGSQAAPVAGVTPNVLTVWKWNAAQARWAFYSPLLGAAEIADYAARNGFEVLSAINPGEGYWVNALAPFTLPEAGGVAFNWDSERFGALPSGFNLIAHASRVTPQQFNLDITPGTISGVPTQNFYTLWAWDADTASWYFHSPLIEASGGLAGVKSFAASRNYLHFEDYNKTLGSGIGFWVNRP